MPLCNCALSSAVLFCDRAALPAAGHSSLGSPSTRYVKEIIPAILDQPGVGGIMFYTMLAPCGLVGAEWPHGRPWSASLCNSFSNKLLGLERRPR